MTDGPVTVKLKHPMISKPLFKQTFKSTWFLWLIMTVGSALIFMIVNIVIGSKSIFTNIDMTLVAQYVKDEEMDWLQILGLLDTMGFSLTRIQVMSQIDLNTVLNDLIYRIAGILLPMIYVMIVSNKLIAAQVTDGSMAYVLSTPTNRKTVLRTQFFYLVLSLVAMYIVITLAVLGSEAIASAIRLANEPNSPHMLPLRSLLYCFASFASMFALLGICFGASAFFNKSSNSLALGGGACIFSFICCILGLFGNKVFVAVGIGVSAMNLFNFVTIFSLIDTESMSAFAKACAGQGVDFSYDWIWKIAIMFAIGIVFAIIGAIKFKNKDLPL